jgi:ribosomal protein L37E
MDQPCDTGAPNGGHEQSNPQHVDCIRCGYNLHGLTMGGTCPECGTPVARTLDGNVLRYSSPEYLNKLQRGILFIVISYILSLAMMLLMIPIALLAAFAEFDSNTDYSVIVMAAGLLITFIGLAVGIISVLGWWWFSEPDTDFVGAPPMVTSSLLALR